MISFLDTGKGLYIEGTDFGYNNSSTALYQRFGCSYLSDGNPSSTGNVQYVNGQSGSFADALSYDHLYQQLVDNYVDVLGSTGGTLFFKSQDNQGRAVNYNGPSNTQRAIHSAVVFGALRNGADTKITLMDIYMNYLTEILGVDEITSEYISNVTVSPNPASRNANVRFSMAQSGLVEITIFNIVGQKVRQLTDQIMAEGVHALSWNGCDDVGKQLSSGSYVIEIITPSERINKTLILVK